MGIEERIRKGFYPLFEREPFKLRLEVLLDILSSGEKDLKEIVKSWPEVYQKKFKKVVECGITDERYLLSMALLYASKKGIVKRMNLEGNTSVNEAYKTIVKESKGLEKEVLKAGKKLWEIYEEKAKESKVDLKEYFSTRFWIEVEV
ncbi:MAG: hypothetical protein J7L59_01955 [Nanoarchaeota archaeon]|nr:hypothetical protein [Nanoarchaeota archaeon]